MVGKQPLKASYPPANVCASVLNGWQQIVNFAQAISWSVGSVNGTSNGSNAMWNNMCAL